MNYSKNSTQTHSFRPGIRLSSSVLCCLFKSYFINGPKSITKKTVRSLQCALNSCDLFNQNVRDQISGCRRWAFNDHKKFFVDINSLLGFFFASVISVIIFTQRRALKFCNLLLWVFNILNDISKKRERELEREKERKGIFPLSIRRNHF